jgi:hypothetical protein
MQYQYDVKKYAVLYVDDEEKALKYFEKSFGDEFRILTAISAAEGLKLIEQHGDDIGVLLSDQRMPGEKGVQLLEKASVMRPRLVRMMVTAYHLDWSPNWFSFAGMPPANYRVNTDKNGIANMYQWEQPLDIENYDYYNIETVHAFRRETSIPKGTVTFSLTIIPPEQGNQ